MLTPSTAVALVEGDTAITYHELDDLADRMSRVLDLRGVRPGDLVAITLPRGIGMVTALLAAGRVGAGYVLVDPDLPAGRREAILTDTAPALVVDASVAAADPGPGRFAPVAVHPDDVATVMFTSGSTGRPKGVVVPHRAIRATYLDQTYAAFDADQVWLQCSPVSWDAFALELFGALLHGATCVLAPGQRPDPETVADLCARHRVTQLQVSASLFNFLVDERPEAFALLKVVFTGGEHASPAHVNRILERYPHLRVVNGYGPVESLGFTTTQPLTATAPGTARVPVGVPVNHKGIRVLDGKLEPAPPNTDGDVYCTGEGLAHGYLNQTGLTASRFLPDPTGTGTRLYATGDTGHLDTQGRLHITGRTDQQIKIRGYRVEPAEITAALQAVPGIRQAAVTHRDGRLHAYITADGAVPADIRGTLAHRLPDYMLPTVTRLARLPLTANGKLDTAALPSPSAQDTAGAVTSPLMGRIGAVWARVLNLPAVGAHDDFFALGGHSLTAVRALYLLRDELRVEIPLRAMLDACDLDDFTGAVQRLIDAGGAPKRQRVALVGRRGTR
ncbi:non-ribosomal peptide synthetase [Actinoplanes sp. NPDC051851]|uniref:non-ribosomal peptide synthetase n=1 Tax=Actinoplanes sp. NPDC051851 TaxID=3154753 RepID=UPI0034451D3F